MSATTALPTLPAPPAREAGADFPDWLSPILVKELRQGVRTRVFVTLFILLQVRVGRVRRRIAGRTQESLSDMTAITEESLSVSGVLLAKVFNRQASEVERYTAENARQVDLQVRSAAGEVYFELTLADAWVWDVYRSARFVKSVRVVTFKDVNVEELARAELTL